MQAIARKELREYRRSGSIVWTMAIIPLIFTVVPLINVFALRGGAARVISRENLLIYMLAIPALVPAVVAAYAIVGERVQGTLEPVLTTPIGRRELLAGKAAAAAVPSLIVSYGVYAVAVVCIELFANPQVASALVRGEEVIAQVIFTPLIAGWSIWLGIAISTRASEIRVAQQLGMLASVPTVVVTSLIAYNVIQATLPLALAFGVGLLVANRLAWRLVALIVDRERLIIGTR